MYILWEFPTYDKWELAIDAKNKYIFNLSNNYSCDDMGVRYGIPSRICTYK